LKSGAQWTIANAREHLSFQKADPWPTIECTPAPSGEGHAKRLGYNSAEPV
jgi:bifunctional non-homologous end joining protein LigD